MSLDEYLFGKFTNYQKRRKSRLYIVDQRLVKLDDVRGRLTIIARAITGKPIDLYLAKREGGYKNMSFFLPEFFGSFQSKEENFSFYIFRILYLSIQKNMNLNWKKTGEYSLKESRSSAKEASKKILKKLFNEFPPAKEIYKKIKDYYDTVATKKKGADYTYIYGKWMVNNSESGLDNKLEYLPNMAEKVIREEITSILKTKAVEEVHVLEVDKKQQEDYVMTHNFEKVDTAEEWDGGWRDFDGADDTDKHENALEDLNMKYTVRVDDAVHSVLKADFVENTNISETAEEDTKNFYICYDEWNYRKKVYKKNFCKLYPKELTETNINYYRKTIQENTATLMNLRKMLVDINNKNLQQRRQNQGEEFDLDALTDLHVNVRAGHTPSEKIYLSKRKKEKDLSILMLLDISLSSDAYSAGNKIIDVEKQVSILFGEILKEFNVDFAISCFYSQTRNYSSYLSVKKFDEDWDKAKFRIGAIETESYTRIGTAIRHSGTLLNNRAAKNKWLLLISDGKANDYDKYEGKYGINDVKQALRELKRNHINSYALAIEAEAKYYLPQMFISNNYQILTSPNELLKSLVQLFERIKHQN